MHLHFKHSQLTVSSCIAICVLADFVWRRTVVYSRVVNACVFDASWCRTMCIFIVGYEFFPNRGWEMTSSVCVLDYSPIRFEQCSIDGAKLYWKRWKWKALSLSFLIGIALRNGWTPFREFFNAVNFRKFNDWLNSQWNRDVSKQS